MDISCNYFRRENAITLGDTADTACKREKHLSAIKMAQLIFFSDVSDFQVRTREST